jgi:hypothetical protein
MMKPFYIPSNALTPGLSSQLISEYPSQRMAFVPLLFVEHLLASYDGQRERVHSQP